MISISSNPNNLNSISINMGIKDRLDMIIKELSLSGRAFERECGLASGSYASLGDGIGADKLNKILIKYPQVSARWLITGEGTILEVAGNYVEKNTDNRLWTLIESQQRQLESQQRTIEALAKKGDVGDVRAVAR